MPCLASVSMDTDEDVGIDADTLPQKTLAEPLDAKQRHLGFHYWIKIVNPAMITNTDLQSDCFYHVPAVWCGASHFPPPPSGTQTGVTLPSCSHTGCICSCV